MPPRVLPPVNNEWGKYLSNVWYWNSHRHQTIIWLLGGIAWALVCWAYVVFRVTGDGDAAREPLCVLAGFGIFIHTVGAVFTVYVYTKIRLFALLRVLLMNLQYLVLMVVACIWMANSSFVCTPAFILLGLLVVRGVLLRSYQAASLAMLSMGTLAGLIAHGMEGAQPIGEGRIPWLASIAVLACAYAFFLGMDQGSTPVKGAARFGAYAWSAQHLAGATCLFSAGALQVLGHSAAGDVLGAALVGLCPAGIQAFGEHAHAAVFYNCAVAAGDLDNISL